MTEIRFQSAASLNWRSGWPWSGFNQHHPKIEDPDDQNPVLISNIPNQYPDGHDPVSISIIPKLKIRMAMIRCQSASSLNWRSGWPWSGFNQHHPSIEDPDGHDPVSISIIPQLKIRMTMIRFQLASSLNWRSDDDYDLVLNSIFALLCIRAGHATTLPRQRDHVFRP